jgi:molecular chaperone GrpE
MAGRKTQGTGGRPAANAGGPGSSAGPRQAAEEAAATEAAVDVGAVDAAAAAAAAAGVDADVPDASAAGASGAAPGLECEEAGAPAKAPAEDLDPLAQAQAEAEEARDRFVRLQAEWDNFRKRTAAEREQERSRAAASLVERLLPIVDDLERATEHFDTANADALREGITAVLSKLTEVLERAGVKTINPVGKPFDANLHQAVGKEDNASVPDETVTQVYQKGYEMGDRVLRSAVVVVSQGGPIQDEE